MKNTQFRNKRAFAALILVTLLAIVLPVSAAPFTIDLDRTYSFALTNVSHIEAIDLGNLSESQVEVLSTAGDDSDLQTIHTPEIRDVTRTFTTTTGTFHGITVTVTGDNPLTVNYIGKPEFKIYTKRVVPTFRVSAPGQVGNPIVTRYNESWNKGDTESLSTLFRSSEGAFLYKSLGTLNINTTDDAFTVSGEFAATDYNKTDINYTLNRNKVALDSFNTNRSTAANMGTLYPYMTANTGKYFAGAIRHEEDAETLSVYAMYPVVVLKAPTPMQWANISGSSTAAPFNFTKDAPDDVTLDFTGSSPDLGSITKVTYLIVNDSVQYDVDMKIDTEQLAQNAEDRWQTTFTPGTQIIDLLYEGIANDVGSPFNYTVTAVGYTTPAPSTEWSAIAITPGFGISGTVTGTSVVVPGADLSQLDPGLYDVYLMGTDADNNIVALDQKQVTVAPKTFQNWVGVFRQSSQQFILDNVTEKTLVTWGWATDLPVSGDWNGDGMYDVGVYRPSLQKFILKNGTERTVVIWAVGSFTPVTGDWNGDGLFDVGIYKPSMQKFVLKNGTEKTTVFWGKVGDLPVTGDWNGDGMFDVGIYRPALRKFLLMNGTEKTVVKWGLSTDTPVAGDWNEDGLWDIGVYRSDLRKFVLKNGTEKSRIKWGLETDLPVTGKWS